ncbi:MAG TPA: TonB-dependent receptor [Puia sp.]|nr:TonB-dependent receptor [Puia sp.]
MSQKMTNAAPAAYGKLFSFLFLLLSYGGTLFAQNSVRITGVVKDKLNKPIDAVSVSLIGTQRGASTDSLGRFAIVIDNPKQQLRFSRVGYKPFITTINNSLTLEILLDAVEGSMEEVVFVGYGKQKKVSLVGAQSSVNVEDLKQPVANLSAVLAGRLAGVVGVQRTGLPGSNGADLYIRGISTFTNSGNDAGPLVIVDGVQGRDINAFDPEDISSFTILKDASATAVYGVAGANGVILITTKKGKQGKPTLMFNYNQGINSFTKTPKLTNGVQYMTLRNEAEVASGFTPDYSPAYIDSTAAGHQPYLYPNVDWMKELFNTTSESRRANFSARGGSESATYYVSVAYYDEKSMMKTDKESYNSDTRFRRYNFTSNVDMNWTKTTKFELGIQGYISNTNFPGVPAAPIDPGNVTAGPNAPQAIYSEVMQTNPVLYPKMYPGNLSPGVSNQGAQPNPYVDLTQTGYQNTFGNQLYTNARLTQDLSPLLKGLSAYAMYSFDISNGQTVVRTRSRSLYLIDKSTPYNADGTPNLDLIYSGSDNLGFANYNSQSRQNYVEAAINFDRNFGSKSHITALILGNQKSFTNAFPTSLTASLPFKSQGLAGRATYGWDDRYFAEFNFGYNGSENFAPGNRYGFFPSFGAGWVISREKWFEPAKDIFQFLKVRYSNGVVGSGGATNTNGQRRFGYLTLVSNQSTGYTYGDGVSNNAQGGISITDYGTDVKWSRSHKQDLGVEFKTLDSKLSVTLDYFDEQRTGVFLQRASLADYAGFINNPWANLGVINNKGFDGTIETESIHAGATSWTFRGTFSYNRDKVIQNDDPVQPFPYMEHRGVNYNSQFGYVAEGLFQSEQEIATHATQAPLGNVRVGDIKYKDLNGDGKIDANDEKRIGNGDVPNWTLGAGFNVQWKQWNFGAFFQGIVGAQKQLGGDGIFPFSNSTGAERSNLFSVAEDRWTPDNPKTHPFYPRLAYGAAENSNNTVSSTWWEENIDFIRLKTIDFGYTLPRGTLKSIGLRTGRFYVQGVNLLYWSKFKLWDPELSANGGTSNGTKYPNTRNVTLGFQANF